MRLGIGLGLFKAGLVSAGVRIFSAFQTRVIGDGGTVEAGTCVVNGINGSALLQQASLLLIPSGYKGGKLYAEIPTNGNGDLTWTRGSDAFRTNASGLIQRVPWNLVGYSEDFTNAYWPKSDATITSNAIAAPNGTTTADKLIATATNANHLINKAGAIPVISGQSYTFSLYAKAAEYSFVRVQLQAANFPESWANFNLSNGTIGLTTGVSGTIESVGNGWYRCSITQTATGTGNSGLQPFVLDSNRGSSSPSYTGDGTSGIYIFGAQVNIGSTAKPYFPTTDRLNVPRLTYQNGGGGCPSLLLEKQSTNYATNSEDFTQWGPSAGTITLNAGTSPDGTNNANLFTEDTTTGYHRFSNSCTGLTGTAKTFSIYAKWAGGTGREWLTIDNGPMAFFDLKNGVVGSVQGTGTSSMEAMGNGWYRCIYTNLNSTGSTMYVGTANANNGAGNHLGNGQPAYYCWGAQAE